MFEQVSKAVVLEAAYTAYCQAPTRGGFLGQGSKPKTRFFTRKTWLRNLGSQWNH